MSQPPVDHSAPTASSSPVSPSAAVSIDISAAAVGSRTAHAAGRPIRVAIVGAGGFAGGELIERLLDHPTASLVGLFGSARIEPGAEPTVESLHPRLAGRVHGQVHRGDVDAVVATCPDAIMLAVPHGASADLVPELLARTDAVVLDLSGTYRLGTTERAAQHYGVHPSSDLMDAAVYGLVEVARSSLGTGDGAEADADADATRLIAVPGCYPTASILPLRPLADAGWLTPARVAISAASGVSGAGRGANERTSYCNISFQPYGVGTHRHAPEIELHGRTRVSFVPHLAAWDRGILATMHATLVPGVDADDVRACWRERVGSPFVRILPDGAWPTVADVRGTNRCDLGVHVADDGSAVLVSAIDNLVKGAAGQAIQCLNLRFGCDEAAGLPGAMHATVIGEPVGA